MIKALKNEVAIDAFDMLNVYKHRNCNIPILRPIKIMGKIKINMLLKIFFYSLVTCWLFIFPLYMLYKFFKYKKILQPKNKVLFKNKIIIATSHRIQDTYKGIDDKNIPIQWLIVPWIKIDKVNFKDKYQKIELTSIIDVKDLLKGVFYSICGLLVWIRNIKHPTEILQSYVLFEYFMIQIALNKLRNEGIKEYWHSNHYDRWSVLLDSSCNDKNVLIQHGFLNENFKLPYKLRNIKKLYFIDNASINVFKKNIVNWSKKIKLIQLRNTLLLQKIKNKEKSILLISRPAQFEFDVQLVKALKHMDLVIYIKPHPLFDKSLYISTFKHNKSYVLIENNNFYPDVSIVISGYSTLAIEYELLGKNIIWIEKETIVSILKKIKGKIKNV